jgi:hypothetical protein
MNYRLVTYCAVLGIFVLSCLVTLLGLIGAVKIDAGFLKLLVGAFLTDSAVCVYALFNKSDFLGDDSTSNLRKESWRALATLWMHQERLENGRFWYISIPPEAANFRSFLRGIAQLHSLELVEIRKPDLTVSLTPEGIHFCKTNIKRLKKTTEHFFVEGHRESQ